MLIKESIENVCPFCGEKGSVFVMKQKIDCSCGAYVTIKIKKNGVKLRWYAPDNVKLQEPVALIV